MFDFKNRRVLLETSNWVTWNKVVETFKITWFQGRRSSEGILLKNGWSTFYIMNENVQTLKIRAVIFGQKTFELDFDIFRTK